MFQVEDLSAEPSFPVHSCCLSGSSSSTSDFVSVHNLFSIIGDTFQPSQNGLTYTLVVMPSSQQSLYPTLSEQLVSSPLAWSHMSRGKVKCAFTRKLSTKQLAKDGLLCNMSINWSVFIVSCTLWLQSVLIIPAQENHDKVL